MPSPKSTSDHERDGTFRSSRHSDRADSIFPKGPPAMPDGLTGHEQWMWRLVVENCPDRVISPADAAALLLLCRWWDEYRVADDEARHADAKKRYKALVVLALVTKRVHEGLRQFGMHPAGRTALKVSGKSKSKGALMALLEMKSRQMQPSRS